MWITPTALQAMEMSAKGASRNKIKRSLIINYTTKKRRQMADPKGNGTPESPCLPDPLETEESESEESEGRGALVD